MTSRTIFLVVTLFVTLFCGIERPARAIPAPLHLENTDPLISKHVAVLNLTNQTRDSDTSFKSCD